MTVSGPLMDFSPCSRLVLGSSSDGFRPGTARFVVLLNERWPNRKKKNVFSDLGTDELNKLEAKVQLLNFTFTLKFCFMNLNCLFH